MTEQTPVEVTRQDSVTILRLDRWQARKHFRPARAAKEH